MAQITENNDKIQNNDAEMFLVFFLVKSFTNAILEKKRKASLFAPTQKNSRKFALFEALKDTMNEIQVLMSI